MRSLSTLTLVLVVGAMMCVSSSASATLLFQDDFEAHNLNAVLNTLTPQVGDSFGTSTGVIKDDITDPPGSAGGGLKFVAANRDELWISTAQETAATNQVVRFSCDAYVKSSAGGGGLVIASFATADPWYKGRGWDIALEETGGLSYYDNGWKDAGGTFETDKWVSVEVVADYSARTFDATVDGYSWTADFDSTFSTSIHTFGYEYIASMNGTEDVFYDNVSISIIPEPSTLALLATGLVGLLCYAWRKRK